MQKMTSGKWIRETAGLAVSVLFSLWASRHPYIWSISPVVLTSVLLVVLKGEQCG